MEWNLLIKGSNEIIGDEGYPVDSIKYSHELYFHSLEELLEFIKLNQKYAIQYHEYEITYI